MDSCEDGAEEALGRLRERCIEADPLKGGYLTGLQFRNILESIPGIRDLTVSSPRNLRG